MHGSEATFHNDVWALGNSVEFTGTAAEHARFFATSEIILGGKVGISAVAIGKTVTLTTNSVIDGDALLVGQSVVVAGDIRGNLRVLAGAATLNGRIDGNVRIVADDIVVMPGTKIGGDLVYTSPKDLFLDPGKVELDGQLIRKELETIQVKAPPSTLYDIVVSQAYFYLCALVAGIPFIAIFPRFTGRAVRWVRQSAWKCALVGFIAFCLIPMTSLFVFFTIIGIPLSLLLLLAYAIMIYLSKIIVALGIGGIVLRRHGPQPFSRVFAALSLGLIAHLRSDHAAVDRLDHRVRGPADRSRRHGVRDFLFASCRGPASAAADPAVAGFVRFAIQCKSERTTKKGVIPWACKS